MHNRIGWYCKIQSRLENTRNHWKVLEEAIARAVSAFFKVPGIIPVAISRDIIVMGVLRLCDAFFGNRGREKHFLLMNLTLWGRRIGFLSIHNLDSATSHNYQKILSAGISKENVSWG
jgi:hypothetical protein